MLKACGGDPRRITGLRGQKNPRKAEACGEILPKEGGGDAGQIPLSRDRCGLLGLHTRQDAGLRNSGLKRLLPYRSAEMRRYRVVPRTTSPYCSVAANA